MHNVHGKHKASMVLFNYCKSSSGRKETSKWPLELLFSKKADHKIQAYCKIEIEFPKLYFLFFIAIMISTVPDVHKFKINNNEIRFILIKGNNYFSFLLNIHFPPCLHLLEIIIIGCRKGWQRCSQAASLVENQNFIFNYL